MKVERAMVEYLRSLPTLTVGQADDLKIDMPAVGFSPAVRVWLSRVGVADGAAASDQISAERFNGDRWVRGDGSDLEAAVRWFQSQ